VTAELDLVCVLLTNRTAAANWTTARPRRAFFPTAVAAAVW